METIVDILKAAGEPTRLRILALVARGELSAGELSVVLGQSQPRVSRHLKLLHEAGLLERRPEGAWVFFRLAAEGPAARLATAILAETPASDVVLARDLERLSGVHAQRAAAAEAYFEAASGEWEALRRLHQPEEAVEARLLELMVGRRVQFHLDLGSGTGRILSLFADQAVRGEGIDSSRAMLAAARSRLDGLGKPSLAVRQADILALPFEDASADLVTLHQVLHYLSAPEAAVAEAARVLRPGGTLLVADFAPHAFEELRAHHAHRRLGFAAEEVAGWLAEAGLVLRAQETVHPADGQPGLAVMIWAAERPAVPSVQALSAAASSSARSAA